LLSFCYSAHDLKRRINISTGIQMRVSVEGIASFSGRRPWWVVLGWVLVLIAAGGLSSTMLESALDGNFGPSDNLESVRAKKLIDERFGPLDGNDQQSASDEFETSSELVLFIAEELGIGPGVPEFDQRVTEFGIALGEAQHAEDLEEGELPIMVGNLSDHSGRISEDGSARLITIEIYRDSAGRVGTLLEVVEEYSVGGFEIYMVGEASLNHVFAELAESDLLNGETIGIGIAIIILSLVFGAVVSAFIPIILAIVAIFTAIGLTAIVGQFMELNEFVPNIISMMGLAVGIDYSLFILSRYREERDKGLEKQLAIETAAGSAGRAVVFSGLTVVLALLGMLIIPEATFKAFGIGAILVVFVAVITGITLLPAIIGILGDRVSAVRAPLPLTLGLFIVGTVALSLTIGFGTEVIMVSAGVIAILVVLTLVRRFSKSGRSFGLGADNIPDSEAKTGFWNTLTLAVMTRPWVSLFAATAILIVLSYFYLDLQKGTGGISALPDDEPAKIGFELLDTKFGFGFDTPALIVIDGDVGSVKVSDALTRLEKLIADDPGLQAPEVRIEPSVDLAALTSNFPGNPQSQTALNTIRKLRQDVIPQAFEDVPESSYKVLIGGSTAETVDSVKITDDYLPIIFATVLSLSFILLLLAFRSITISIASIIMNLLSVGAAYGLLVLVFQKGFLIDVFGFKQVEQIEFFLPLFMFSILFGLSMDYHVFMLSRIKERYDETGLASESVAFGLRKTASIITGAALIMVAVFGGFALGDITMFQSMGFGLGAAVLLDATIVRSLLVPSVMRILGKHAWYLPSWLEWIPNISIEGRSPEVAESGTSTNREPAPEGAAE
jgi:RND superfamily putative drug exporter